MHNKTINNEPDTRVYVVQYIDCYALNHFTDPIGDDTTKYDDDGRCSTITINAQQIAIKIRDAEPIVYNINKVACLRQSKISSRLYLVVASQFGLIAYAVECHLHKDLMRFAKITFKRAQQNMNTMIA